MRFIETIRILVRVFGKYRLQVATLVGLGFLSAIFEGIGINAVIPLMSFFTGGGTPTDFITSSIVSVFAFLHIPFSFRYLLGFVVILFFVRAVCMVGFSFLRGYITADFLANESKEILRHILSAQWPYLLRQKLGTMQNTAIRDIQRTRDLLFMQVQFIQSLTGLLMYLLVAFNISPFMTTLTMAGGAVLILVIRPLLVRTNRIGADMSSTEKEVTQFLAEHIIGMKTLKASGREERALKGGARFIDRLRSLAIRITAVQSISASLFQPFSVVFVVILFAATYRLPGFSIISFAATLYLIQKIFTYMDSAQSALHGAFEALPYAHNVLKYKEALDDHKERGGEGEDFSLNKELRFENVSLSYEGREGVLQGVSFTLKRGSTTGIIGPSGAGKTSLADLLLRLFVPTDGRIVVDSTDAQDISLKSWRQNIGYVSQDVFLLNGSLEDNIRFYQPELSEQEIIAAARKANIHDFIESLPQGYKTQVGDRGVLLSGGQRQRVALARALATHPSLLVLDEATSALDNESERLIQEAIRSLHGSVTVVMIAHRLSTIEAADRVLVLEGGRVVADGTPEELRRDPHSYLSRMQEL
jgi:ABC-type multidrug transport system fused ATPase/permease subunit